MPAEQFSSGPDKNQGYISSSCLTMQQSVKAVEADVTGLKQPQLVLGFTLKDALHALSESACRRKEQESRSAVQVEVINTKQLINYNKALRFVERGYAAFVGDDRRKIRYLEDYEQMRLRADLQTASYNKLIDERGHIECRPMHSGKKPMAGGPKFKTLQMIWGLRTR
jgi:hypothetical protein